MKSVIQRVKDASVSVDGERVGYIEGGLLVYLGVEKGDSEEQLHRLCSKIVKLRVFADDQGKMNLSLKDVGLSLLVISQFTLCANLHKGNRPSYNDAADPEDAVILYERAVEIFRELGFPVEKGSFGEHMDVTYTNDGPVTLLLES